MKLNFIFSKKIVFQLLIGVIILPFFSSCEKEKKDPIIETSTLYALSASTYKASAKVVEVGDYKILDHGFVYTIGYGSSMNNASYEGKISLGNSIKKDTFSTSFNIGSVQFYSSTPKCYVKAYITNDKGTIYGKALSKDVLRLQVSNISPSTAKVGDTITINGENFSTILSQNSVTFNSTRATIVSVNPISLKVIVPTGITTYYYDTYIPIHISSGGQAYDLNNSFQLKANATSFTPNSGSWNTTITVNGSSLYNATLYFNDVLISTYNQSSSYISGSIPSNFMSKKFKIYVSSGGVKTEVPGGYFTMPNMVVNPLTQLKYFPGSSISFTGSGFHPSYSYNKLILGTTVLTSSYGYSNLQFSLPTTITSGDYSAIVTNGLDSIKLADKISIITPTITTLSPTSGYPGTNITIKGANLLLSSGQTTYVYFGTQYSTANSTNSDSLSVKAPWIVPGNYPISVHFGNFQVQSPENFTVIEPKITSISPSSGIAGSSVIINGEGFGTGNSIYVNFGNLNATVMSSSNTQINVKVPSGVTSGSWMVKVSINYYTLSSSATYTVP